jgi:hypothetical protein
MKKRHNLILLWSIGLAALLVASLVLSWMLGWLKPSLTARPFGRPGAADSSAVSGLMADEDTSTMLRSQFLNRLNTPVGFRAWYQQADRSNGTEAAVASNLLAGDQLRYGAWLIEQDYRGDFLTWWSNFRQAFMSSDGLVLAERTLGAEDVLNENDLAAAISWPDSLTCLRILGQAYERWPERLLDQAERALSDRLLQLMEHGLTADRQIAVPTSAPTQDPGATPTPKPAATPTPAPAGPQQGLLQLASLDLLTLRALIALDNRWQAIYDQSIELVKSGYLDDNLPLYALGWLPGNKGYLMFAGSQPVVDTEQSIAVILHLAEIGQAEPRSLSWIKERLFNDRALYKSYHLAQGQPTSSEECLPAYAMVARIARITGDQSLYLKAVERLSWHLATSSTSDVRGAIFRQDGQEIIRIFALDNTWAMLAFD